jgi:hypothetical protein
MSEGPPWMIRMTRTVDYPPAEYIQQAVQRIESLTEKGFTRQPRKRPDPEPANDRTYRDDRNYVVSTRAYIAGDGHPVFEIAATTPCAV